MDDPLKPSSFDLSELRTWVSNEASALVGRLVAARATPAVRELDAARKAFDAATRSIEAALNGPSVADAEIWAFMEQCSARVQKEVAQLDAAHSALAAETARAAKAEAELAQAAMEFEASLDELRQEHATVIGRQAQTYTTLPLDQLLTVFHALRKARTIAEALTTLVDGLASEFSRVALLNVRDGRLTGEQQRGFEYERDISKVVVPLSRESLLGRAVSSGRIETFIADPHNRADANLPFGGTPTCVLAMPIVIQGATTAVIYADDSDKPEFATAAPLARAKFAELLQQHAMLELLRVSVEERAVSQLQEYAARLMKQIEQMHSADAEMGRNPLERQQRLRHELEHARRIYAERAAHDERGAATFFDERLAEIAGARRETIFGQDLAAILGSVKSAAQKRVLTMPR